MKFVACVLLVNEFKEVLAVSRKDNHHDFGLPGGKMEDSDKDIVETAIRELKEETGIRVLREDLELIYASHHDGMMSMTFLAKSYSGIIKHNEPHIADWIEPYHIEIGSFGKYNTQVLESYIDYLNSEND